MHELGYTYTGPASLYGLTFQEVASLSEGQRLLRLTADGVTDGEEAVLNRLAEEIG